MICFPLFLKQSMIQEHKGWVITQRSKLYFDFNITTSQSQPRQCAFDYPFKICFILTLFQNDRSAVFEAITFLTLVCHKSAITYLIGSNKVSNSKLRHNLCKCSNNRKMEVAVLAQQPRKWGAIFWGHPRTSCTPQKYFS